ALDRRLFAVENRTVSLQKVSLTRGTVELAPGAATGRAIGPQIAEPEPSSVVTAGMRTNVHGGAALTGPPIRLGPGVGRHGRRRLGMHGVSLTEGAVWL